MQTNTYRPWPAGKLLAGSFLLCALATGCSSQPPSSSAEAAAQVENWLCVGDEREWVCGKPGDSVIEQRIRERESLKQQSPTAEPESSAREEPATDSAGGEESPSASHATQDQAPDASALGNHDEAATDPREPSADLNAAQDRLALGRQRLSSYPENYYAVQLAALSELEALEQLVAELALDAPLQLKILSGDLQWYVLIEGVYSSYQEARSRLAALPPDAWIRPVGDLQQIVQAP